MNKFVLIDLNNYFSRFFFANQENCIERYLKLVKDSINLLDPQYLCNLIDAPISFRKGQYPNYKANRPEKPKEYYELLNQLKFNLKKFNYPIQTSKSLEAEDLANLFVKNITNIKFIILSNDKDCLQLESKNCQILDYFSRKDESGKFQLFVEKTFKELGLMNSEEFRLYLSCLGDSSDNIPGVKGLGPLKALSIVHEFNNYDTIIKIIDYEIEVNRCLNDKHINMIRKDLENFKLSYKLINLFYEKWEFNLEKYKI